MFQTRMCMTAMLVAGLVPAFGATGGPSGIEGCWDGQVALGKDSVHVRFDIHADGSGTILLRTEESRPLDAVSLNGNKVEFAAVMDGNARVVFRGTLGGNAITGTFTISSKNGRPSEGTWRVARPSGRAPQPGTLAGFWDGNILKDGQPSTPVRLELFAEPSGWTGSFFIKDRKRGHVLEEVQVQGPAFSAKVQVEEVRLELSGELKGEELRGAYRAFRDGQPKESGSWGAARTERSGVDPLKPPPLTEKDNPTSPRPVLAETGIPVFPGAEGFGTRTPAGRGGRVLEVTTLADSGPGSLREALAAEGKRIVVFRVGGTIEAQECLYINHPFLTVAGQTAPGGGICIKGAGLVVGAHDVLIQHLRIRPGDEGPVNPDTNDAIAVIGAHDQGFVGAHHVVMDHCSLSWSEDEILSVLGGAHDVTVSWCVLAEALNRARHHKKTHSAGVLVGYGAEHVSLHHNLLAHNGFRNPLFTHGGTHEFVNNVVYDWQDGPGEIVDRYGHAFLNFIGNCYRRGPSARSEARAIMINPNPFGCPRIFSQGNLDPHRTKSTDDPWTSVGQGWGGEPAPAQARAPAAFRTRGVTATSAEQALKAVLAGAGATRPLRDAADERVAQEVEAQKGCVIDSPKQVGGYPELKSAASPPDADHDGMPDSWERACGLDPRNPADGGKDRDGDGYTNVEEFLHSLLK